MTFQGRQLYHRSIVMGLASKIWDSIKKAARTATEPVYARNEKDEEIKYPTKPGKGFRYSKHQASKPRARHFHKVLGFTNVGKLPITNHERVVVLRARRMKISVQDYCRKFGAVLPVR
jgi:hypothetical protein